MKKRLLIFLGVFALGLFAYIVPANAQTIFNTDTLKLNNEQAEITEKIEKTMKENSYPSYYGGTYISDDSTHVILQIVKNDIPDIKKTEEYSIYDDIKRSGDNIEIVYVNNSYKELNDINDRLVSYFSSKGADISNLGSHYVDAFNNVVVVELFDNNNNKIDSLKKEVFEGNEFNGKILDSKVVNFIQGKEQHNHATTLKAGQQISVPGGLCSMGYRVKINGQAGYITTGHCFNGTGDSATGGTVTKYKESGKVDAAFVKTTTSYSPSNSLYYTSGSITTLNNTLCPFLSVNQAIAKAGRTTGYTSGQIKNLNYSATYDGIYFTGLIAANYSTSGGDSGGAVFVPSNVSGSGGAPLAGINKGTSSYGSAFVNTDEIYLAFGYSRY